MSAPVSIISFIASSSFIVANKRLLRAYGAAAAIFLGELASEFEYLSMLGDISDDGYFYSTIEKVAGETGLSRREQDAAIKTLVNAGILSTNRRGVPAKRHFKLNFEQIEKALLSDIRQTCLAKNANPVCTKTPNCIVQKRQTVLINSNNINNNRESRTRREKKKCGAYNNVFLSDAEIDKLMQQFPDAEAKINRLSEYLFNHRDNYKSHYKTILVWAKNDEEKERQRAAGVPPPIEFE